jgi:Lar family restriction alleviation protein
MDEREARKPCPFCGGPADLVEDTDRLGRAWAVFCEKCDGATGYCEDGPTAVAAWNRRAALASAPAATQGEAVAWRDPSNTEPGQAVTFSKAYAEKWPHIYKQPLYTTPQPTAPAERVDALCDAAYVAGAQAGFNAAASDDPDALSKLVASRSGYIEVLRASAPARAAEATQPAAAPGYKLVPMIPTPAMNRVMDSEGWAWEDLLAAACAITEDEYEQIAGSGTFQPAPPAAAEQRDAQRYRKMRAWFVAEGRRSDITPNGHICIITAADVDAGVDALPPSQAPAGVEAAQQEWMSCATRAPWVANSLRHHVEGLRAQEKRSRGAYRKDFMRVPVEYFADALADAAAVIEAKLAVIDATKKSHPQEGRMP